MTHSVLHRRSSVLLVVSGGGSGGRAAAFRASEHGARVALLEPGELGGTCVNVGCVPKKAMWLAAQVAGPIELAAQLGFEDGAPKFDWCEFITHRQRYITNIHASYRRRLDESGIVTVAARGRLVDARPVECANGVRLRAGRVVFATGGQTDRAARGERVWQHVWISVVAGESQKRDRPERIV